MIEGNITFADGLAYERMMGVWSRLVGEVFLEWLSPQPDQRWIDVGCGNGAFTEVLAERSHPTEILGIDPSAGLLNFARKRHARNIARFELGDAMALPSEDDSFDAAVMALVIFFVPDPAKGVAEMNRVVRPGGMVSAYVWDILEPGGFPMAALQTELCHRSITTMLPPRADVSSIPALRSLWNDAGLTDVATREITVTRTFPDFEDYWASVDIALRMLQPTQELVPTMKSDLKNSLRVSMPVDATGHLRFTSRANAITGKVNSK
jgi:ubiquinone/menaquinone biosynthesis C-methylase UbiE